MPKIHNFSSKLLAFGMICSLLVIGVVSYPMEDRSSKFKYLTVSTIDQCLSQGYNIIDNAIYEVRNSNEMKFTFDCSNGRTYDQVYTDTSDILLPGGDYIGEDAEGRLIYYWEYRYSGRIITLEFHLYRVVMTGIDPPGGFLGCSAAKVFGKVIVFC